MFKSRARKLKELADELGLSYAPKYSQGYELLGDEVRANILSGNLNGKFVKIYDFAGYKNRTGVLGKLLRGLDYLIYLTGEGGGKNWSEKYVRETVVEIDSEKKSYRGFVRGYFPVSKLRNLLLSMRIAGSQ